MSSADSCFVMSGPFLSPVLATVLLPSQLQLQATFNGAARAATVHLHVDHLPLRLSRQVIDSGEVKARAEILGFRT